MPCFLKDYNRVWTQGSTDHRGTPDYPGRTVTLEAKPGAKAHGRAYLLPEEQEAHILEYLEEREKQYDERLLRDLFEEGVEEPAIRGALVYIATEASENYLGNSSTDLLARQISKAKGPSGDNSEYLYMLAEAMRDMGVEDQELFDLESRVKQYEVKLPENTTSII
eukprot:CAMPEP_0196571032 /NCGR_PEP_ID=MMETSP1081-20130531/1218_1 /TAXON_ID=36882 /ORGANISM="Pyramimonas amylifera, Strain CCMP720" /LENGTH=165 /DNA_ID=CAMNT_0041887791 /DNA_START=219 /DNA_END=716 /DNA_ORIENTATION=-